MTTIKVEIWAEQTVRYRQTVEVTEDEYERMKNEEGMRSPHAEKWIDPGDIDTADRIELLEVIKLKGEGE